MDFTKVQKSMRVRTSRSSGAGGQHVNKVSTRVEVLLDLAEVEGISAAEKKLIYSKLKNRISKSGILSVAVEATRSQLLNRNKAIKKLQQLLEKAVLPPAERKAVKALTSHPKKRLQQKRHHSEKKALRQKIDLSAASD